MYSSAPARSKRRNSRQTHIHAAGQRRRHGVDSRNELRDDQQRATAAIKRIRRSQNARFRIERNAAQQPQQPPAGVAAQDEHQRVAREHRNEGCAEAVRHLQDAVRRRAAGNQQRERGRYRQSDRLEKYCGAEMR